MAIELAQILADIPWVEVGYTIITVGIALLVSKIFYAILKNAMEKFASKTKTTLDDILVKELETPVHLFVVLFAIWLSLTIYPGMQKYWQYFDLVIQALLIAVVAYGLTKTITATVKWYMQKKKGKSYKYNYLLVAKKLVNAFIYIIAFIIILAQFGIEITPLIASLGVGGLAVALAFQDTLANYFSGIYISTDKDMTIGDYIEIPGLVAGTIVEIGWRATKIKTWDGNLVIIPNKKMAESTILDYSKPKDPIMVPFEVGVSYKVKSDKALKVLSDIVKKIKKQYPDLLTDSEPTIRIERFDDSNIIYKVIVEVTNRNNKFKFMAIFNKALAEAYEKGLLKVDYPVIKLAK